MNPGRLNNRLELWRMTDTINELDEDDKVEAKIKSIWCNIVPKHGSAKNTGGTEIESTSTTQIIKCRKLSISQPKIDMFFRDKTGLKYEVLDFYLDYKNKEFWEFKTRIVYE